jgi:hypothetical protein
MNAPHAAGSATGAAAARSEWVVVYAFHDVVAGIETGPLAPFKATRQTIVEVYRGRLLEGTREKVPREALDAHGRYRRVATGWGDLN